MEFTKYDKYGAYHWKQYEDVNTKYHRHANRVKKWVEETSCLDVGAGDGMIAHLLGIPGIDDNPTAVRLAREKGADVRLGDARATCFQDEQFESVFLGDVLEHIEHPEPVLEEMRRIISKRLYIASPIPGMQNDPFHYKEWTEDELTYLVEDSGFILLDIFSIKEDKRIYARFEKWT